MSPSFADPSERDLGLGEYLLGALELGLIVLALGFAAVRLRRALLPGWSGPPALVADVVGGLTLAAVVAQILGSAGAFTDAGYLAGCLVIAVLALLLGGWVQDRRRSPAIAGGPPAPRAIPGGIWVVAAVCALVVASWMVSTISGLTGGMGRADSLWYHMPLALRFVETGSTADLFFFDPIFFASFYPANSEVFHAIPILSFGRDFLSPAMNIGFLGLGLLAGWAIGRPYGVGPQTLCGAAVVLGAETMVGFQAGEALNDVVGVSFLLCAVALLVNGFAARRDGPSGSGIAWGALAFAGAAAGLAAGTKLSFLAPVAVLAVALVVLAARGRRLRVAAAFSVPALLAGGYWYLRNLLTVGNPIPYTGWGPLGLPAPERDFELRPGFSVAHYLTDTEVWRDWFAPAFAEELGLLWPLILIASVGGGVWLAWRGRDPVLRALGAVAALTAVLYVFTPLTAGGEEGQPIAFEWNIRYLAPAIAIGLASLPCLPALVSRDPLTMRIGGRGFTMSPRALALAALAALVAVTTVSGSQWGPEFANRTGAVAAGAALFAAWAFAILARSRGWIGPAAPRNLPRLAVAAVAGIVALSYFVQSYHLERRYQNLSPELNIADAARWGRDLRDARIAVSGVRGVFNQYVFSGTAISNHVQWLGVKGEEEAFLRIGDCETWRQELNAGGYDFVVTMYDPYTPMTTTPPGVLTDTKEALWTREDPGAEEVLRDGPVSVFRLDEPLDPAACGDLPDLSPAELNGDSVNLEQLSNQPPPGAGS